MNGWGWLVVAAIVLVVGVMVASGLLGQELERRACAKVPATCEVTP